MSLWRASFKVAPYITVIYAVLPAILIFGFGGWVGCTFFGETVIRMESPEKPVPIITQVRSIPDPEKLVAALSKMKTTIPVLYYAAPSSDEKAWQYLREFLPLFSNKQIKKHIQKIEQLTNFNITCATKTQGVFIMVRDRINPPKAAVDLKKALINGGITPEPSIEAVDLGSSPCRPGVAYSSAPMPSLKVDGDSVWFIVGH